LTPRHSAGRIAEKLILPLFATQDQRSLPKIGGPNVAHVPLAHPESRFTAAFEDTAAWLTVWSATSVVRGFFDELGTERANLLTHVSADKTEWMHTSVAERAPQAPCCAWIRSTSSGVRRQGQRRAPPARRRPLLGRALISMAILTRGGLCPPLPMQS
jgi:hypothetical protein